MSTFPTPDPIELRVRLDAGDLTVVAEPRPDTNVEVRPANPRNRSDVDHAAATRIDHRNGVVVVEAPDHGTAWRVGRSPAISVRVALPEGSRVRVVATAADVRCHGRLGAAETTTASGDVEIEHAAALTVQTASGDIRVGRADGNAKLGTSSGSIAVVEAGGDIQLSSASGDISVGHAAGEVGIKTASGDASIDVADGSVAARTASGDAQVRRARRGSVTLDTASGDLRIGIVEGTAAWLDVQSLSGDIRSSLEDADGPAEGGETVRVRARTLSGDISVTRAS